MSARDDFGSSAGRGPGAGGLGNGGIGGGMGAGSRGGGAGYNGGAGSRTGLTTGTTWHGNTAFGAPGGRATGYATRDAKSLGRAGMGPTMGQYGGFKTMSGNPMFGGSPVQGQSFNGMGAGQAFGRAKQAYDAWKDSQIEQGPLNRPTTNRPTTGRPKPSVVSPFTPPELDIPDPLPFPPAEEVLPPQIDNSDYDWRPPKDFFSSTAPKPWPGQGSNPEDYAAPSPRKSPPGTRTIDSTNGGYPSLSPPGGGSYPPGVYASGGLVRSAMLTAKGVNNGMKGALVVNQKGNVVSGKLKSGPIVQVGTGGNVMKRGTVKITWGS